MPNNNQKIWTLALPDWESLDHVWKNPLPFALWQIGEQPLLFHWLDFAVDQGIEKIILLVADRPNEVRHCMNNASLWPLEWEVVAVSNPQSEVFTHYLNGLPSSPSRTPSPGWDLIHYWHELEQEWLKKFEEETRSFNNYLSIGKFCEIAKDVQLIQPYWIGSFVSIGPGSTIGPGAIIEDGSLIAGNNTIKNAHIGSHTYLGPQTDLINAAIHQDQLLNFKHEAKINGLEAFILGPMKKVKKIKPASPSLNDRLIALKLLWKWRGYTTSSPTPTFIGIDGETWPEYNPSLLQSRIPLLKHVLSGKLLLFGVTPRPESSITNLPPDWQTFLKSAQVGAFGYPDILELNTLGTEDEALHSIYQSKGAPERCRKIFNRWIEKILSGTTLK